MYSINAFQHGLISWSNQCSQRQSQILPPDDLILSCFSSAAIAQGIYILERAWRFLWSFPNVRFSSSSGRVGRPTLRILKERKLGNVSGIRPLQALSQDARPLASMDFILPYSLVPLTIAEAAGTVISGILLEWQEQDAKQILYCKLQMWSGQAQLRREVMLWDWGDWAQKTASCPPLAGDLWECTCTLLCPKHSHNRAL